ncbi:hypothetical protein STCU_09477, partial [Strigomonas culicis]
MRGGPMMTGMYDPFAQASYEDAMGCYNNMAMGHWNVPGTMYNAIQQRQRFGIERNGFFGLARGTWEPTRELSRQRHGVRDNTIPPPSMTLREAGIIMVEGERPDSDDQKSGNTDTPLANGSAEESKDRDIDSIHSVTLNRLSKLINDFVHVVALVENPSMRDPNDKTKATVGDTSYAFDEVHEQSTFSLKGSDILTDIAEHAACGHNVSVLGFCCNDTMAPVQKAFEALLENILKALKHLEAVGDKSSISVSAVALPEPDKARDLLASPVPSSASEVVFGSNPIYGPCIMDVTDREVRTPEQAVAILRESLKHSTNKELVNLIFKIKQQKAAKGPPETTDVYVSSIFLAFFRDSNMSSMEAIRTRSLEAPGPLFSNAVGGASRTAVLLPLTAHPESQVAAEEATAFRTIQNTPIRSGNVRRFVEFSSRALEQQTGMDTDSEYYQSAREKVEAMMRDGQALLEQPDTAPLVVYPLSLIDASDRVSAGSAADAAQEEDPLTDRTIRIGLLLQDYDANLTSERRSVTLKTATGEAKEVEVDEVYYRMPHCGEVPRSRLLTRVMRAAAQGLNVSILAVERGDVRPLKHQFTWGAFLQVLEAELTRPAGGVGLTEVFLSLGVVQQRDVIADLLAPAALPIPLVVTSSPLFGPVVNGLETKPFRDYAALASTVEAALDRAEPFCAEEDTFLVSVAVLKKVMADGDVILSSVFVASASTIELFNALQQQDPKYSRSLFAYAMGGPCTSIFLYTTSPDGVDTGEAQATVTILKGITSTPNHVNRVGSIRTFVNYANTSVESCKKKVEAATTDEEKEQHQRIIDKVSCMLPDHEE